MKQNISKNRSGLVKVILSVLVVSAGMWSCRPDYDLDKRFPEWLGTSIYETLKDGFEGENGKHYTFNYYVRLIDTLDQKNILARTGSRTLFVADDEAFQRFLDKCPIAGNKAVKFGDLTKAQLKMILKGSMLNNVFQVAALSSTSTDNGVRVGDCMRRVSTLSEYDTVRILKPQDMPKSEYWDYVRNNPARASKGILIMEDGTRKPMIFFSRQFLESRKMTNDDYNFLFNLGEKYGDGTKKGRESKDASVNGVRIEYQNKKCYNGFIHVMEDVVYILPSMAEYIAQSDRSLPASQTSIIWSSIIERFSAPFIPSTNQAYDADHTGSANALKIRNLLNDDYYGPEGSKIADVLGAGGKDSVFSKFYFSSRYSAAINNKGTLYVNPQAGKQNFDQKAVLKFDPGWNTYFESGSDPDVAIQEDMAAMLVPTDEAMMKWWLTSTLGREMRGMYGLDRFKSWAADDPRWTPDSVAADMSAINLDVIAKLVNNNMFSSLTSTVPSKFTDVLNDAQDPFFTDPNGAVSHFKNVVMCCNGALYFSDMVFDPTAYKAVSYPSLVNDKLKVLNWAIHDEEMAFKYYLLSMETAYGLFLPEVNFTDDNESVKDRLIWVDPSSFMRNQYDPQNPDAHNDLEALAFFYDEHDKKVKADVYDYDAATNTVTSASKVNDKTIDSVAFIRNRMEDFMDYHIVLLGNKQYHAMEGQITADNNGYAYFRTKGGGTIRFKNGGFDADPSNPDQSLVELGVQGGWQVETGQTVNFVKRFDMTLQEGNGVTYVIDKPLMASRKSVYDILSDTLTYPEFTQFFRLMESAKDKEGKELFRDRYDKSFIGSFRCVSTFNTYNYTVYVPCNDSIQRLLDDTIIFRPAYLDLWDSIYGSVCENIQYNANASTIWRDSIKLFFSKNLNKTIANNDPILQYNADFDSTNFKLNFLDVKRSELINFLKYHIQDNSVYTNAEFNRGESEYETAYLNDKKQYGKLTVTADENITIKDLNNNERHVLKSMTNGTAPGSLPYWNIMTREYVFKTYASDYKKASDENTAPTTVATSKLETSSYAVIHLIDGALCNGEVKF